jgi:hypothetical protein
VIVLYEVNVDAETGEDTAVVGLEEEPAIIAKDRGADDENTG